MPMNNSNDSASSKILTFAVGGALLVGSAACGGGVPHHINEPVPTEAAEEATETTETEAVEEEATESEATEEMTVNEPAPE